MTARSAAWMPPVSVAPRGANKGVVQLPWTAEACNSSGPILICLPCNTKAPKRGTSLMKQKAVRKAGVTKLRERKKAAAAEGT